MGFIIGKYGVLKKYEGDDTVVEVPKNVRTIGDCAFYSCLSLEKVVIQEGIKTIGNSAFCNCQSLKEINIPNSVNKIENDAFKYCIFEK